MRISPSFKTYWRAFDAGEVVCSQRTFYRIATAERLVGDQRRTRSHGFSTSRTPAVATTGVGELWSWDITELRGPTRADRYYLYLAIDVFSRYPVAWCIEYAESKDRAVTLFTDAITTHGAPPGPALRQRGRHARPRPRQRPHHRRRADVLLPAPRQRRQPVL
ncbi:DDE-type integrase/transposase/recombinase [Cryobacterium sp.]|uniref:DDE-type integrase/transposase/recombinase n=1 Tax=Cryobacterium sp. TaxID=1926290 RepID=UPI00345C8670